MNTNDELRAMLDERNVNWDYGITGAATTKFRANGVDLTFIPMRDGLVCTTILTPAQAIAATLGVGTCHMEYDDYHSHDELYPTEAYECSACGAVTMEGKPNFCPNCGRKVVDE